MTDAEIAANAQLRPMTDIAARLGLTEDQLVPYGRDKAKVSLSAMHGPARGAGRLILVSAITPTPAGEGKTTTSIGLADGLSRLGEKAVLALREPSLGPCMGMKGGATGGGHAQIAPATSINLHFTGDFHAITSAHNLLAAALDNQLHFGNPLQLDPRRVSWPRVLDMNDRSLRNVILGLGGTGDGMPREGGFEITAASEVMAMLCLARDAEDLRARIDRTVIGWTREGQPVRAAGLNMTGAMLALLSDALAPNLVQTLEGTPALVHGGPFANIAHGCNSVTATRMASHLADWCITEAGFGFDLGGEKFLDIKCADAGLNPAAIVLVATVRALKMHGGRKLTELSTPDAGAVAAGLCNLERHIQSAQGFGRPVVVACNRFASDTDEEIAVIADAARRAGVGFALAEHHSRGGEGAEDLAGAVLSAVQNDKGGALCRTYDWADPVADKIHAVATKIYGAEGVDFSREAEKDLRGIDKHGFGGLPICIAKTQYSLSDDPSRLGAPRDFRLTVRNVSVNAGAGFLVVLTGDILRMPGLPRRPQGESIDLRDGKIVGLR